ncbi:MAG: CDGSH iron-sulfur domain-containing protein [bacterium]
MAEARGGEVLVTVDGPYIVSGGIPLRVMRIVLNERHESVGWRSVGRIPVKGSYALCRCGRTATPPFCDGSHERAGFDGTETASREPFERQARVLHGAGVWLADAQELCASARFCLRSGGTWFLTRRSRGSAARRTAVQQAANCPAGRLVARRPGGADLEPKLARSIALVEDPLAGMSGPLWLRGSIPVIAADGFRYEMRNRVTLCRCGRSRNKPFCDGNHAHD